MTDNMAVRLAPGISVQSNTSTLDTVHCWQLKLPPAGRRGVGTSGGTAAAMHHPDYVPWFESAQRARNCKWWWARATTRWGGTWSAANICGGCCAPAMDPSWSGCTHTHTSSTHRKYTGGSGFPVWWHHTYYHQAHAHPNVPKGGNGQTKSLLACILLPSHVCSI
jgi:hypothetical protein